MELVKSVIEDSESLSDQNENDANSINSTDASVEPGTSQQTETEPTKSVEEAAAVTNILIVPAAVVAPVTSLTLLYKVCIYSD